MRARRAMALAHALSTDGTRPDFIGREQRGRLVRAGRPVPRAHHAPRSVGAAQVWRAMHLSIHHADGLMRRADGSAAAGALRHLVHAHRLVGAPLTVLEARRAQATASLGRLRVALLRVPVADDPAATAARSEARRAGLVPILGADALVCRAVLEPARRADADVFITCRLPVHATLGDAVVGAEVLGADRAAVGAGLAGAVVVPADRERRRRATAMRTCHDPGSRASQRPLRAERRATPPVRLELPLGALYQGGPLDQLQGVHDGLHLAAPDLLGSATLGERGDGSNGLRIGLLFEDRLEVPVQAAELGSKLLLRRGAPRGDPLRRLFLEMAQEQPQQVPGLPGRDGG